jgi:hypothetical protein
MAWNFQREESSNFVTNVPEGKHRIRVKSAEKAVSKSGNDMLVLQFDVSGYNATLYHYIVFMADKPQITNRMLTQFFDSFKGIPEGQFDTSKWIGQVGACVVKHEEYNGNTNAKISYFINADKQGDLPAWKEPGDTATSGFVNVEPSDLPEIPF